MSKLLASGQAICYSEPRGEHGLEPYMFDEVYRFEKRFGPIQKYKHGVWQKQKPQIFFKLWPDDIDPNPDCEVPTVGVFRKYFKIVNCKEDTNQTK